MIRNRLALPALVFFLAGVALAPAAVWGAQQEPGESHGMYRTGDWDTPPRDFNEIERRGFHDGIEGARKDFGNHRRPDVNNRDEYRHPHAPPQLRAEYREGFRLGYERGMANLTGGYRGPEEDRGPDRYRGDRDRGMAAGPAFEIRRRGFQAGMEGALRDFDNHRRPDPDNRDEYRHPPVPGQFWDLYREGFRRGYQAVVSDLMNGGDRDDRYREQGPRGEARMQGFRQGMDGALHDYANHRRPDPNNRDEYRHPRVPYGLQDAYRDGFRDGYGAAMRGLMGMPQDPR